MTQRDETPGAMRTLARYDRAIGDAAAPLMDNRIVKVLGSASDIADQKQLFGVCLATTVVGMACGDRKLAATGVRMTAAMLLATVLKGAVEARVDRTRPWVVADGGTYTFQPGDHDVPELDGFPSGHTAGAVAVARAAARNYPAASVPLLATAAAIAVVQVPRAKHYPGDLIAGAVVGWVADLAVAAGWSLLSRSRGTAVRRLRSASSSSSG